MRIFSDIDNRRISRSSRRSRSHPHQSFRRRRHHRPCECSRRRRQEYARCEYRGGVGDEEPQGRDRRCGPEFAQRYGDARDETAAAVSDDRGNRARRRDRMACAWFRAISFQVVSRRRSAFRRITIRSTDNGGEPVQPVSTRPAELSYRAALSRMLAQSQFGNVDLLIIDLASGLDRLYSLASMVRLDGVLLLTHPSSQDTIAVRHAMKISARNRYANRRNRREHGRLQLRRMPLRFDRCGRKAISMESRARRRCRFWGGSPLNRGSPTAPIAAYCSFASMRRRRPVKCSPI